MFSRRHYRIIALVLAAVIDAHKHGSICPRALVAAFARALTADNPRFNRAAFERAIGLEGKD